MSKELNMSVLMKNKNAHKAWSFTWCFKSEGVVNFEDDISACKVIYTRKELERILSLNEDALSFIPVPSELMHEALSVADEYSRKAA